MTDLAQNHIPSFTVLEWMEDQIKHMRRTLLAVLSMQFQSDKYSAVTHHLTLIELLELGTIPEHAI
jgi:hypothetical protein